MIIRGVPSAKTATKERLIMLRALQHTPAFKKSQNAPLRASPMTLFVLNSASVNATAEMDDEAPAKISLDNTG